ncbi:hypothetical protein WICMUC_002819 [Wickerhamomyces mucosus]|uniref:RING-type domain-containing protein n=1 Tax=Wickerhamomyces mucosus TaxID=1378264 RepID=A0A9P8PMR6_9ASCO|nr:hypothetical protein WICMUC_002819 [Wickerhamomyces mucosus]
MSNKFNPNASVFIPGKQTTSTTSSPISQTKLVKSNLNMSSHAAPPASNPKSRPSNQSGNNGKTSRSRESRNKQNKSNFPLNDDFDFHLEDEVMNGHFKARGKRGQISINHLLDFSLPSRDLDSNAPSFQQRRRRRSSNNHSDKIHLIGSKFINANYRFIVDYRFDYRGQVLDPNLTLDKNSILRVVVPKGHHCPICLTEDIVAPRMISCGHIFCSTCLLSFLDSEPIKKKEFQKFKECPLCTLSIKPSDVLPVTINETDERFEIPQIGHDVVLKLMAKPMENILPIPHSLNLNHKKIGNIPWYSDTELYPYARIMKGGLKYALGSYEDDKAAILKQYEEDKIIYNDDGEYVNKALDEINENIRILKKSFDENYNEPNHLVNSFDNLSISKTQSGLDDGNCYFFYQTCFHSTTRYFLSPLDVKVLSAMYGSYSHLPTTLLLKIENISYGHMVTEQTLKRFKYFSHLPLGTELAFIDVHWPKDMISPEASQLFAKELNERRKKILNKLKKEDRDKKKFDTEQELKNIEFFRIENQGWGFYDFGASSQENVAAIDDNVSPPLNSSEQTEIDENSDGTYQTTIWGTKIPKSTQITPEDFEQEDDSGFEQELLRLSKEEEKGKKKGRKKKVLVLTSTSGRAY